MCLWLLISLQARNSRRIASRVLRALSAMAAQGAAGAVQTISSQPRPRTSGTAPPSHPTSCHAIVARRWARKDGIGFSASNKPLVVNAEKKKSGGGGGFSFGDQLLDYIEGKRSQLHLLRNFFLGPLAGFWRCSENVQGPSFELRSSN